MRNHGRIKRLSSHTDSAGKHLLIIDVTLNPRHQMLNVFRSWHLRRPLEALRVLPEVLEPVQISKLQPHHPSERFDILLIRCLHLGTRLWRTKLGDGAIEQVDLIVEIHNCDSFR